MNNSLYTIASVTDKEGNKKEPITNEAVYIKFAEVGRSAILFKDDADKGIATSTVEEIKIWDNTLIITTVNSIYYLKTV